MDHFEDARIKKGNRMHTCVAAISHALRIAITTSPKITLNNRPHNCFGEQCYGLLCGHFAANQPQQVSCLQLITPNLALLPTRTEFDETSMVNLRKQPSRNKTIQHSPNKIFPFQFKIPDPSPTWEQERIKTISNLTLSQLFLPQRTYPVHQHHRDGAAHQILPAKQNGCRWPSPLRNLHNTHPGNTHIKQQPGTTTENSKAPWMMAWHTSSPSLPACMYVLAWKGAKATLLKSPKPRDHCIVLST